MKKRDWSAKKKLGTMLPISMAIMLLFDSTPLLAQEGNSEPEEPDYAFIAGEPYTQENPG